jgi:hypothetical protein
MTTLRDRAVADTREALWVFHDARNTIVYQILNLGDEYRTRTTLNLGTEFSQALPYRSLFHPAVSDGERVAVLSEAFDVAAMLFSDEERTIIDQATAAGGNDNIPAVERFDHYQDTSAYLSSFMSKLDAAQNIEGEAALYAFVLMYGYGVDEVAALSVDEVRRVFGLISSFKVQLPWALIEGYLAGDIDSALLRSLMDGRSVLS